MNYCTKCDSFYTQPGTCNCFAASLRPTFAPQPNTFPYPYVSPYIGDPIPGSPGGSTTGITPRPAKPYI